MRYSIDLVEFHRDHSCKQRSSGVEDHTASLHDVDCRIRHEAFSGPSRIIGMRIVIAVEDGDDVWSGVQWKEVIQVVRFRGWARDFDDSGVRVLFSQVMELWFQRLYRPWGVVKNVDSDESGLTIWWPSIPVSLLVWLSRTSPRPLDNLLASFSSNFLYQNGFSS